MTAIGNAGNSWEWGVERRLLGAIEALDPASATPESLRLAAADGAAHVAAFTNAKSLPIWVDDALGAFDVFVRGITIQDLDAVEPLPYRRTLTPDESRRVWDRMCARWGKSEHYWFPIQSADPLVPGPAVAFDCAAFDASGGEELLRRALELVGLGRVLVFWELANEPGTVECEIDVELLDSTQEEGGSAEFYVTDETVAWMIYESHESTITIAGAALLDAVKSRWPTWESGVAGWPNWEEPL